MENNSIIFYPKKNKKYIIDFLVLPLMGIFIVMYLSNLKHINMKYILYNNNYIIIDYWFFIHVFNAFMGVLFYPYTLSVKKLWFFVIGWEIVENIVMPELVIPNINYNICNFSESFQDITGDLIAPVPATLLLYYINSSKNIYIFNYCHLHCQKSKYIEDDKLMIWERKT